MGFMHNNKLRMNANLPDDLPADTLAIYREHGWANGLHKDTDPEDRWTAIPRVLPEEDVDEEPETPPKAVKATTKKD